MSTNAINQSERARYIVRARDDNSAALAAFLAGVGADSDIDVVDTIGPQGRPHTAVVAIASDKALAFERRFQNSKQLSIERDRPLSLD
ncbi:MAG TPA: hypothetical protein VFG03_02525 [Telluria sp.]|nr:hypothetical protein [Telluria sp.]